MHMSFIADSSLLLYRYRRVNPTEKLKTYSYIAEQKEKFMTNTVCLC